MLETYEFSITASKAKVRSALLDPFLFSGVMGHISILQVVDEATGEYVSPGKLIKPGRDFRVLYVFGTPDTKLHVVLGYMRGPEVSGSTITYSGRTDDHKLEWKAEFYLNDTNSGTSIKIGLDVNYKTSALDKLVGKSPFQLAQHFIQEHIIPYMKLYFKEEAVEQGMSVAEIQRIEGDIAEIVPKIRQLTQNITTGFIIIKGNNLRASIQVINGQPTMMKMIKGNKIMTGNDVLASLVMESGSGVAVAYEMDVEKALDSASEQVSKSIDIGQRKYESQA